MRTTRPVSSSVSRSAASSAVSPHSMNPAGSVQSVTDFGQPGFGGPCPPVGDKPHRYIFTVHALKLEKLPLEPSASSA